MARSRLSGRSRRARVRSRSRARRPFLAPPPSGPTPRRLGVELLEDRRLLSLVAWDGGGGDASWHNPLNWDMDALPGASDDVVIDVAGDVTVEHASDTTTIRSLDCQEDLNLSGGSLTMTAAASQIDGALVMTPGSLLTVDGAGASLVVSGAATVDGASIVASGGATVSLPAATSYTQTLPSSSDATLKAEGTGSVLDLSHLSSLEGSRLYRSDLFVQAVNGGRVDLSGVTEIPDGAVALLSEGSDSVIDASSLSSCVGYSYYSTSALEAKDGGSILNDSLTNLERVDLTYDGSGTISTSQITSYQQGAMTISGAAPDLDNLSSIDGASIVVTGGAALSLPAATSYTQTRPANSDATLKAEGPGSVLDLSQLTRLTGSQGNFSDLFIQALAGGRVDLSGVTEIPDGAVSLLSEGTDSVIDISSLTSWVGSSNYAESALEAGGGGTIELPGGTATRLEAVTVVATETGTYSGHTIELAGNSQLIGSGTLGLDVINHSTVRPGHSPGILVIEGDFVQGSGGRLAIELGGLDPGSDHSQLQVAGSASLDGSLDVSVTEDYVPSVGDAFVPLTFASRSGAFEVTGNYDLGFSQVFNDTRLSLVVEGRRLAAGEPLSGDLTFNGNYDYFRFDAAGGEHLIFRLNGQSSTDENELYVRYGAFPTLEEHDFAGAVADESGQVVDVPVAQPGTYYAMAYAREDNYGPDTYELRVDTDTTLQLGDTVSSHLGSQGDFDLYRFEAIGDQRLFFTAAGDSAKANRFIYLRHNASPSRDEYDVAATEVDAPAQKLDLPASENGNYYVLVYAADGDAVGDYELLVDDIYFHIVAIDRAKNRSTPQHLGPFSIENGGPTVRQVWPENKEVAYERPTEIRIALNDYDVDASTITTESFVVEASGGDRTFDDGNEIQIADSDGVVHFDPTTRTATFVPASPLAEDTYRIVLFDSVTDALGKALDGDGDGLEGGHFVGEFQFFTPVAVSGIVSEDTTWRGLFLASEDIVVAEGATLTIAAGSIIKFDSSRLDVKGTLDIQGNLDRPVVFTSLRDDTVGGDTNGDGDATRAAAGDWFGVRTRGGSATISGTTIKFADIGISAYWLGSGSSVTVSDSRIIDGNIGTYFGVSFAEIEATNTLIADNRHSGIQFLADADTSVGTLGVYVRQGSVPTAQEHDVSSLTYGDPDPEVLLLDPVDGTYYIGVYGQWIPDNATNFTLFAESTALALHDIAQTEIGNTGRATLELTGENFAAGDDVYVIAPDGVTQLESIDTVLGDRAHVYATFDFSGAQLGDYDVVVDTGDSGKATLEDAITVIADGGGQWFSSMDVPSITRPGRTATITFEYGNAGRSDMYSPLITLMSDDDVQWNVPGTDIWMPGSIQILALSSSGRANVLRPGQTETLELEVRTPFRTDTLRYDSFVLGTDTQAELSDAIPWEAIRDASRPAAVLPEAWQLIWENTAQQTGETWGDYVRMLGENAAYLASLGQWICCAPRLFAFEVLQANGLSTRASLDVATDTSLDAPGMAIEFTRTFGSALSRRFYSGPLGRGWTHSYDLYLERLTNGDILFHSTTGGFRAFTPDEDGKYNGRAGDYGVLTSNGDGTFSLREKDGLVYRFTAQGSLDSITDRNGNSITAAYEDGRLVKLTHNSGQWLELNYSANGRLSRLVNHEGRAVHYDYDAAGEHLVRVTGVDNRVAEYQYVTDDDAPSLHAIKRINFPDGTVRHYAYDDMGRLSEETSNGGAEAIQYVYDDVGNVQRVDAMGGTWTYSFDWRGLVARVVDPLGNNTSFSYDNASNLHEVELPDGYRYNIGYDLLGNVSSVTDPNGNTNTFHYDYEHNQLDWYQDARGNTTHYQRDPNGNVTDIEYADGTYKEYATDPFGNYTRIRNRRGEAIEYQYDEAGRLAQKDYPDGASVEYSYDARGNLVSAIDPNGTVSLQYDAVDRLQRITFPSGRFLEYVYDAQGRRTEMFNQDDYAIQYVYDQVGRLAALTDDSGQSIAVYQYDAAGRLSREDRGNGTYTTYAYDAAGQMLSLVNYLPDDSVSSKFTYTYDARGNRVSMATHNGIWTYEYDAVGQLTHAVFSSADAAMDDQDLLYEYDSMGNRVRTIVNGVETQYVTNALNQYTAVGTDAYLYDADGNLIRRTTESGVWTYEYDVENRLVAAVTPDGTWSGEYDVFGGLAAKQWNGQHAEYQIDPFGMGNVIGQFDSSGSPIAEYIHGLGLVSQVDTSGAHAYYEFDALGNAVAITDVAGTVVNSYAHSPFGVSLSATENVDNPFRFVARYGVVYEPTGLHHMRERHYAPAIGRFVSPDPIGISGGLNLYAYANNDAVNTIDPEGTQPECPSGSGGSGRPDENGEWRDSLVEIYRWIISLSTPPFSNNYHVAFIGTRGLRVSSHTLDGEATESIDRQQGTDAVDSSAERLLSAEMGWSAVVAAAIERWSHLDIDSSAAERLDSVEFTVADLPGPYLGLTTPRTVYLDTDAAGYGWFIDETPTSDHEFERHQTVGRLEASDVELSDRIDLLTVVLHELGHVMGLEDRLLDESGLMSHRLESGVRLLPTESDVERVDAMGAGEATLSYSPLSGTDRPTCDPTPPPSPPGDPGGGGSSDNRGSVTPEDKFGPRGYDDPGTVAGQEHRFIADSQTLAYRIDFWNKEDAVVPTQDAVIVDQLDPNLDPATLNFERIGFLEWDVDLAGGQVIDTRIDCRPKMNIVVEVKAGLGMEVPGFAYNDDIAEDTLVWWFHTIDPETGEWPEDPMAGFLPPFDPETGFNIGWVEFTVDPVDGLTTGTELSNLAYVEFDFLADLYEHPAPWINTIDAGAPTSAVSPLPAEFLTPQFEVTWAGEDDAGGSGLAHFDIYISQNGGPFGLWLNDTTDTSAFFDGEPGNAYAFYSVGTDNVGNREEIPETADTQTMVVDQTPPSITQVWVRAPSWDDSFSSYITSEGLGDENGYIIPLGSEDQFNTLPWSGIDTLTIAFSEEVNIAADQVHVYGVNTQEYSTDFAYNAAAQTATLTFESAIDVDKLRLVIEDTVTDAADNALDGEWEDGTSTESGDGTAGGDFQFRFDVLPGDATDSGNVVASDVSVLASAFGSFAGGSGDRYSVFVDYDGSGNVVAADVSILASHFGQFLPSGDPTVPVSQATSTTMSAASSTSVSESVSLPPAPTASATTSDTVETTSPATTVPDDSDSDAAAESVSPETDEPVLGPVRPAPPVPGTPAALAVPVEVHDAVHVQPTAPETVAGVTEPWEQVSLDSRPELVERSAAGLEESLFAGDESVETLGQSSGAVHASEDDLMPPGSCVRDVTMLCTLPVTSVSDADVRSLVVDRDERFAEAAVADPSAGTVVVDELLSDVEPPVPGLYEPSGRSAAIDAISRDLQSGRRSDTLLAAVSIDEPVDSELSSNREDKEENIDRWSEAVDAVLELGTMF